MGFEVKNSVALVTGANRGIGKAIVEALFDQAVRKVYIAVRTLSTAQQLVDQYGDRAVPLQIDLNRPETIPAAAGKAHDVELLVNNAGILSNASPLSSDAIDSLLGEININVIGLIRMAQAFAPVLKKNGGGALVQLNSIASLKCFPDFATYSASKAAAYSITQGLREKLGDQGTQVLSVHPGPIATDMIVQAGLEDMAEPPSLVADGIVSALKNGDFHLFPDSMARQIGEYYSEFSRQVIEADLLEA